MHLRLKILISAYACGHVAFWRPGDKVGSFFALGLTAALVGLSVQGMVDTVFYRPQVQFIFWLVLAALVVLRDEKPGARETADRPAI